MNTLKKIVVEDYNPEWAVTFRKLKKIYEEFLGNLIVDVIHVGSTSVEGLAAKPKLDIDIIIESYDVFGKVRDELLKLGYTFIGDLGVKDREAFRRINEKVPVSGNGETWMEHNLYVCLLNGFCLKNHLPFRDYLRNNPAKANEYGELKKKLALKFPFDMNSYIKYKTPFVAAILRETGVDEDTLKKIIADNDAIDLVF